MKIIKEGIDTNAITEQTTCYKCLCTFEYGKPDIKSDQRDGDYIECPSCKAFISAGPLQDKIKMMRLQYAAQSKLPKS